MNKKQLAGILMFTIGCTTYFFVSGEPFTTIAGLIAGLGFGLFVWGFSSMVNRQ